MDEIRRAPVLPKRQIIHPITIETPSPRCHESQGEQGDYVRPPVQSRSKVETHDEVLEVDYFSYKKKQSMSSKKAMTKVEIDTGSSGYEPLGERTDTHEYQVLIEETMENALDCNENGGAGTGMFEGCKLIVDRPGQTEAQEDNLISTDGYEPIEHTPVKGTS